MITCVERITNLLRMKRRVQLLMGSLWTRVPCARNEPFPCEPNVGPGPDARGDPSHLPIVIVCHSNYRPGRRYPGAEKARGFEVIERGLATSRCFLRAGAGCCRVTPSGRHDPYFVIPNAVRNRRRPGRGAPLPG